MKLVRKLLRLLPFILLLFFALNNFAMLFHSLENYDITLVNSNPQTAINTFLNYISSHLNTFVSTLFNDFMTFYYNIPLFTNIFDSIADFFSGGELSYEEMGTLFTFPTSILIYELFISFMFLIFDVFNFIFGVASNWLRKGEKLNE